MDMSIINSLSTNTGITFHYKGDIIEKEGEKSPTGKAQETIKTVITMANIQMD